jgi:hypothetical protein
MKSSLHSQLDRGRSSQRRTHYCIFLLVCLLPAGFCRVEAQMNFDEVTYRVADMMGPPQKLVIRANGETTYDSYSNISTPELSEIGEYAMKLPTAEIEALNRNLDGQSFKNLPDHWGRIAAGDRYKRVTISSLSGLTEKIVGTTEPIDPKMANLIFRMDQIVTSILHHPKRVLRMTASNPVIESSGLMKIDFELFVAGTEAVDAVNPIKLAGGSGLSVRGLPDRSSVDFRSADAFSVNANNVTEIDSQSVSGVPEKFIQLEPGKGRKFRATAQFRVAVQQTYQIQLVYQNTATYPENPTLIVGEIFSKAIRLQVPATNH